MYFWHAHKTLNFPAFLMNWSFSSNLETICKNYLPFAVFLHCHIRSYLTSLVLPDIFSTSWSYRFFHFLPPIPTPHCSPSRCIIDSENLFICSLVYSVFFFFLCILLTTFAPSLSFCKSLFSTARKKKKKKIPSLTLIPIFQDLSYFTPNFSSHALTLITINSVLLTAPSKQDPCFHSILFSWLWCSSIWHCITCLLSSVICLFLFLHICLTCSC